MGLWKAGCPREGTDDLQIVSLSHLPILDIASPLFLPLLMEPEGFTGARAGGGIPARYFTTHMQVELHEIL